MFSDKSLKVWFKNVIEFVSVSWCQHFASVKRHLYWAVFRALVGLDSALSILYFFLNGHLRAKVADFMKQQSVALEVLQHPNLL